MATPGPAERLMRLKGCFAMLLGAGVAEAAKHMAVGLPPELALAATPAFSVVGSVLAGLASNEVRDESRKASAERNHHLRLGMAEALQSALSSVSAELGDRGVDSAARFALWDSNLVCAQNRSALDLLMPGLLEEDSFALAAGDTPEAEQSADALGDLLFNWLTTDARLASSWSPEEAREVARRALPHYFKAFKRGVIEDTGGHLFKAFVVNGHHQLIGWFEKLSSEISLEGKATRDHITAEVNRLAGTAGAEDVVPQDWRPQAVFLGRGDQLNDLRRMLVRNGASSVFVYSLQGLLRAGQGTLGGLVARRPEGAGRFSAFRFVVQCGLRRI